MIKCAICHRHVVLWAWQPFGPDSNPREAFTTLGSHYRGFPVVKVCQLCHDEIQTTGTFAPAVIVFEYKRQYYGFNPLTGEVDVSPF